MAADADDSKESLEDLVLLKEHEAYERCAENKIVVDLEPRKWHPALLTLRARYRDAAKDNEKYRKQVEKRSEKKSQSQVRFDMPISLRCRLPSVPGTF